MKAILDSHDEFMVVEGTDEFSLRNGLDFDTNCTWPITYTVVIYFVTHH